MRRWQIEYAGTHYELVAYDSPAWRQAARAVVAALGLWRLGADVGEHRSKVARFPVELAFAQAVNSKLRALTHVVYLGPGVHPVSEPLTFGSGVSVLGAGALREAIATVLKAGVESNPANPTEALMRRSGVQVVASGDDVQAAVDRAYRAEYDERFPS